MEKGRKTTVRLTLRIPSELADWIKEEARKENISMNAFVLKILNHRLKSRREHFRIL